MQGLRNEFEYIANPLINSFQFLKDIFGNLLGRTNLIKFFLFLGLFFSMIFIKSKRNDYIFFIAIFVIIPIQLILLSDLSKGYWFLQRQFVFVMPYFILLIGWAWDGILEEIQKVFKKRKI